MFVDKARIMVKGGNGGNGCCSFRREKFVPKGGPDGGDGGGGGNVILETTLGEQSLVDFVYNRHFVAPGGPNGKGKDMHGRRANDIVLKIPVGTVIRDAETKDTIVDMDQIGMSFVIAKGGRGGRGNARFLSNRNKAPRRSDPGEEGEIKEIELELKTIADIGLVGFPNAGKSTLLGAVSNAHPTVAPYPFTTLHPFVGVVEFDDFYRMTIADIPGLIDGAHDNVGLGHAFLKHIERTKMLAYILDTAGVDGRNPIDDYKTLQQELELYMKGLSTRRSIVIANKMDLPESEENLELFKEEFPNLHVIAISAMKKSEHTDLKQYLRDKLTSFE